MSFDDAKRKVENMKLNLDAVRMNVHAIRFKLNFTNHMLPGCDHRHRHGTGSTSQTTGPMHDQEVGNVASCTETSSDQHEWDIKPLLFNNKILDPNPEGFGVLRGQGAGTPALTPSQTP